jgi:hypothetical protein
MRRLALALALALPLPAAAQEVLANYAAIIEVEDIYNSDGLRLTDVGQILQQDRANLHRFKIVQPGDEGDPLFGDAGMRARMPELIQNGWTDPQAARDILGGSAWVYVTVWGKAGRPHYIDVTLTR